MTEKRPIIIGLTGSIGMGKSTVSGMFEEFGIPVFDADAAVHILQGPGGALVDEIEKAFPGTTNDDGVDRQKLGAAVLGDKVALARLEAIIHPAVGTMRMEFLTKNAEKPMLVFDIPLLFEKGGSEHVDHVVVVSASEEEQRRRVLGRPGMSVEKFEKIKSLQTPDDVKRKKADFIIDTGATIAETRDAVKKLVEKLIPPLA